METKQVKHTPEPWHLVQDPSSYARDAEDVTYTIRDDDDMILALVIKDCVAEHEANARLMMAAPELLEVCKKLLAHAEWMGTPPGYDASDFVCRPSALAFAAAFAASEARAGTTNCRNVTVAGRFGKLVFDFSNASLTSDSLTGTGTIFPA